ncbi:MAG: acyl-CoA thioesterase [Prevotellaceae bacterium]|nr:acyl-CoA thioesterase [Prevotellaceae bacterium]
MKYIHELRMQVRDYECDLQGIVNNANYQHYTEHARHMFLHEHGISFAGLHARGIDAVVARMALRFKTPLRPGDAFTARLALRREGVKYVFRQDLFRESDGCLVFSADVETCCLIGGRLGTCAELDALVDECAGEDE